MTLLRLRRRGLAPEPRRRGYDVNPPDAPGGRPATAGPEGRPADPSGSPSRAAPDPCGEGRDRLVGCRRGGLPGTAWPARPEIAANLKEYPMANGGATISEDGWTAERS